MYTREEEKDKTVHTAAGVLSGGIAGPVGCYRMLLCLSVCGHSVCVTLGQMGCMRYKVGECREALQDRDDVWALCIWLWRQ